MLKKLPTDIAVILLMDNINIHKGKHKHLRIFKEITPSMWNFTGRAFIISLLSEMVKMKMGNKEDMCQSQRDAPKLTYSDIFYSSKNKDKLFEKYKDYYVLSATTNTYNCLPNSKRRHSDISEAETNPWISASNFSKPKKRYNIHVPWWKEGIIDMTNRERRPPLYYLCHLKMTEKLISSI
jgi:hypothetical protein